MYNYFHKTKTFLRLLVRVNSCYFFFVTRQKIAERKLYQDVIQLLQKQPKESSSLCSDDFFRSFSEVLQKDFNPLHTSM